MFDHQGLLNKKYDTIVIGAGISGLTIALIFAKEGKKVALFEKDRDVAPLIRPFMRKGCQCSPGLHMSGWLDEEDVIFALLRYLNVSDGVEKEMHENGFGNIIIGSKRYHIPRGFDNVEKALLSYFPENVEAVTKYISLVKEVIAHSYYFNRHLGPKINNHHQFSGPVNLTLKDCLKQYHASQELIDLLGTLNYTLIGSNADEVPFNVHAFVWGGFYNSPGYFTINGINRLLSNFKRELAGFGVDLFLKSEVDEILVGDNRNVTGIKMQNGDQYLAPVVVTSFNPKLLNGKIKHHTLRPIYKLRLDEAENTCGLYVAFYKVMDYQDLKFENIIYHDKMNVTLGTAVNKYGGNTILSVILATDDSSIPDDIGERKIRAGENLKLLETLIYDIIPNLKGKMVLLEYVKPWSYERYTKTINGSAYGIKQTVNQIGFQHKVPIKGLYLVGQAIYPGFLGSMISGFSLACELFNKDEFWPRVINQ